MRPTPTPAIAGLLTMLALAPGAAMADTVGAIPLDPDRQTQGDLAVAGQPQRWTLNLERGRVYAVWAEPRDYIEGRVLAAGGATIARFAGDWELGAHGVSFRAPYSGAYTVVVTCPTSWCGSGPIDEPYWLGAARDCPGDKSSACRIAVGATLSDLHVSFAEDGDWFGTTLEAGASYAVTVSTPGSDRDAAIAVRTADGTTVVRTLWDGSPGPALTYRPTISGAYFVEVASGSDAPLGRFSLSLALTR